MSKVSVTHKKPVFVPVVLTITLETQEEVDALYTLGNTPILSVPKGVSLGVARAVRADCLFKPLRGLGS